MSREKKVYKTHRYSCEEIDRAVADIKKGMTVEKVAKKHGIPRSTLHTKLTGKVPEPFKKGPKPTLTTAEENRLAAWILHKAKLGFPMYSDEVKKAVQRILEEAQRENPFTNNRPGNKWLGLFLRRHPGITRINAEVISNGQPPVTEEKLRRWFRKTKHYLITNGLESVLTKPGSIFNGDETEFQLSPKNGQISRLKQDEDSCEISSERNEETIRVLCTFSAAGMALPPMILLPSKRIPAYSNESVSDNWPIGQSGMSWMLSGTFYEYMTDIFYPWCIKNKIEFPVIYFVDGHKSHLPLELNDFCIKHNILIYPLFPNSKFITQPCNVAIFRSLKYKWREVVREYGKKIRKNIPKETLELLLQKALDQLNSSIIIKGFKICGLYPFDENAIDYPRRISIRKRTNSDLDQDNDLLPDSDLSPLTYNDFLSTKKFFDHFIGDEMIDKYSDIKQNNKTCYDPVYVLWQTCIDGLEHFGASTTEMSLGE